MSLKTLLLLAAAHLAQADSSHALFYKVVDRETAQRIASIKGLAAAGNDTPVFNDQVRLSQPPRAKYTKD